MAVNEKSGFLKYKDEVGNTTLLYPITTKDNIDGMDEIEAELAESVKFTAQALTDDQKAQARANIGVDNIGGVTEARVSEMINEALGGIENGYY